MRKTAVAGVTAILTGLSVAVVALPAQAATSVAAACSTHWGTGPRDRALMVQNKVHAVRAGQHACFDRLVVDLGVGRAPGYHVSYVRAFHADGSGKLVRTSGHAKLLVVVRAPATVSFNATNRHLVNVAGLRRVPSGRGPWQLRRHHINRPRAQDEGAIPRLRVQERQPPGRTRHRRSQQLTGGRPDACEGAQAQPDLVPV